MMAGCAGRLGQVSVLGAQQLLRSRKREEACHHRLRAQQLQRTVMCGRGCRRRCGPGVAQVLAKGVM